MGQSIEALTFPEMVLSPGTSGEAEILEPYAGTAGCRR